MQRRNSIHIRLNNNELFKDEDINLNKLKYVRRKSCHGSKFG